MIGIVGQQPGEIGLRQLKEAFIVPQRVIRIEADHGQVLFHFDYVLLALFSDPKDVI